MGKSNLEPSPNKFTLAPSSSRTPPPQRRDMGTPPPHPKTPPVGSKRAPSPLARSPAPSMSSSYTAGDKKSLIPEFSPSMHRKTPESTTFDHIHDQHKIQKSFDQSKIC